VLQKDKRCVKIVEAGLISAGLPCCRLLVVGKCRLHDSLPLLHLIQRIQMNYLFGALYLAAFAPAFVIADFIALVETNSST
jgi:hypothetical protein